MTRGTEKTTPSLRPCAYFNPFQHETTKMKALILYLFVFISAMMEVMAFTFWHFPRSSLRMRSSSLSLTLQSTLEDSLTAKNQTKHNKCHYCDESFISRNALFRHIRQCPAAQSNGSTFFDVQKMKKKKQKCTLAIRFAYYCTKLDETEKDRSYDCIRISEAQLAGKAIENAFLWAVNVNGKEGGEEDINVLTRTQASIADQRHSSLSQEVSCGAANDMITLSIYEPKGWVQVSTSNLNPNKDLLDNLVNEINSFLDNERNVLKLSVRVSSISQLPSSLFHAENSCTQYIYHYMMPLKWLKGGDAIQQWWLRSEHTRDKQRIPNNFNSKPPNNSLKILSAVLKRVESITLPNRRVRRRMSSNIGFDRKIHKIRNRKLGTVSNKERRAWHNFADPLLKGDASPSQEPVWRVVDKCRVSNIILDEYSGEVSVILEFRGDGFMPQQVRRIVGTAIAVTNDFLPSDIFDVATQPDICMPTILAPPNRLYLHDLRFHLKENSSLHLFQNLRNELNRERQAKRVAWLQKSMLYLLNNYECKQKEEDWIQNLKNHAESVICSNLMEKEITQYSDLGTPALYKETLSLLRKISESEWPETSTSRSKVIRNMEKSEDNQNEKKFGSFTIVDPTLFRPTRSESLPLANKLYPDLVMSVFKLERSICDSDLLTSNSRTRPKRNPSTHCAVNFNARFTPHVDSGIGLGQSLSMIVGIGDYSGGELFVEGISYSVRYTPLEFDGWKQRHWTGPFTGERFSLVWFSPETNQT